MKCVVVLQKKRSGSDSAVTVAGGGGRRYSKKAKAENTASTGHAKVRTKICCNVFACPFPFYLCFLFPVSFSSLKSDR